MYDCTVFRSSVDQVPTSIAFVIKGRHSATLLVVITTIAFASSVRPTPEKCEVFKPFPRVL